MSEFYGPWCRIKTPKGRRLSQEDVKRTTRDMINFTFTTIVGLAGCDARLLKRRYRQLIKRGMTHEQALSQMTKEGIIKPELLKEPTEQNLLLLKYL